MLSSLRLARECGRRHCDVVEVRDKAIEDLGDLRCTVYPDNEYRDTRGRTQRCCDVREDGVMLLIGRLRGAKPAEMMM